MPDRIESVRGVMAAAQDVTLPDAMQPDRQAQAEPEGDPWDNLPPPPPPPAPPEEGCVTLPLNDHGNGQRFVAHYGSDLLYEPKLGWHVWQGSHYAADRHQIEMRKKAQLMGELITKEIPYIRLEDWQMDLIGREGDLRARLADLATVQDDDGKITEAAKAEATEIGARLSAIGDLKKALSARRKAHRDFARSSGNKGKIDACLTEASPHLAVAFEDLDAEAMDVNCRSGIIRFSVKPAADGYPKSVHRELIPHDKSQRVTKIVHAHYDTSAKCPRFMKFLHRIQPSGEMRDFLQRWFGLSMTGVPVQALTFFYGSGANGKSILVEVIAKILGDYAADIRIETLTGRNSASGASATPDLVYLVGARMARASEPREGEPLQDGLVKSITSGEPIMVRPNFGDFFRFYPVFKMVISGNHKPVMHSTDDGIWRRINLVPFDVQIPEAERIPTDQMMAELLEERDGILRWLVEGFMDYLDVGLAVPDQVRNATAEYREESDPIGSFIAACCDCTGDPADRLLSRDMVLAFNWWQDQRGDGKWTERRVSTKIKDKAGRWKSPATGQMYNVLKSSGVMHYTGIRFNPDFGPRFAKAPRDQEGRPMSGRLAHDD